ncbi:MAG: pseudouridine synthase [Bacteroidota bacterium]
MQKPSPKALKIAKPLSHMRLNKLISNAGICPRRAADDLIQAGHITVNGQKVTTLGYQVSPTDTVKYQSQVLKPKPPTYILVNKPKDYITTVRDPQGRKTVLDLVKQAATARVYPIGRLDRNTTGLLLLTNDGQLAQKLAHPSKKIKKVYEVSLDQPIRTADFKAIQDGVALTDGIVQVDELAIVGADRKVLGIAIHMGKNRIIRRLFEQLGYQITKLDRVLYASLTKKNLPRGQWRFLTAKEVRYLKYLA